MDRPTDHLIADVSNASATGRRPDPFRTGASLVEAAIAALVHIADDLERMRISAKAGAPAWAFETPLASIRHHIESAGTADDNLLICSRGMPGSVLLGRALSRGGFGTIAMYDISIERGDLAMTGDAGDRLRPFDRLRDALAQSTPGANVSAALEDMAIHVAAALSRLSIARGRLDLQSSFLAAIADAEIAPKVDSTLDAIDARALALETRSMLSRRSLDIGNRNRRVLQDLIARETTEARQG